MYHGTNPSDLIDAPEMPAPDTAKPARAEAVAPPQPVTHARFGHLFPKSDYKPSNAGLHELAELMREQVDNRSQDNRPAPDHAYLGLPSGHAFLGQFIDHDITFDPISRLGLSVSDRNFRSPALDLDSVYAGGPDVARHLYDVQDPLSQGGQLPVRFLIPPARTWDLPRNDMRTALIGDPRNDENHFISQLHRRMLGLHNAVVRTFAAKPRRENPKDLFEQARKLTVQHYHAVIRDDFLPRIIHPGVLEVVLAQTAPQLFRWQAYGHGLFMPVEFSVAAYRFGHSMIRSEYQLNAARTSRVFDLAAFDQRTADDAIDWTYFVGEQMHLQFARKIDSRISKELFDLPFISSESDPPTSLPERNLRRGRDVGLPSGQTVAEIIAERVKGPKPQRLSNTDLGIAIDGLGDRAPLWYYVLRESELVEGGRTLGLVGSWLVAEVLVELMRSVPESPLNDASWRPTLPSSTPERFTLDDLVKASE